MARDDRRRRAAPSVIPTDLVSFIDKLKESTGQAVAGTAAEAGEIFTAQAVDVTLVPEVVAAKLWSLVPEDIHLPLPTFLGGANINKPTIMKWVGTPLVMAFTAFLASAAQVNPGLRDGFIKAMAPLDPTGGVVRATATVTGSSFEGMLEGLGQATARHLIEFSNMSEAERAVKIPSYLAKWEEWKRIAQAKLGRITGSPAALPVSTPTPTTLATTITTTPATPAGARTNVSFVNWLAGEQNSGDATRKARADGLFVKWGDFQSNHPAEATDLADPILAANGLNPAEVAADLELLIDGIRTPATPDPRTGAPSTPLMRALVLKIEAARAKAYPPKPAAPTTPTAVGGHTIFGHKLPDGITPTYLGEKGEEAEGRARATRVKLERDEAIAAAEPGAAKTLLTGAAALGGKIKGLFKP